MLFLAIGTTAALANSDCEFSSEADAPHARELLIETLFSPECASHYAAAAALLLSSSTDETHVFDDDPTSTPDEVRLVAAFVLLREALWRRDATSIDVEMQRARTELAAWQKAVKAQRGGDGVALSENAEIRHPGVRNLDEIQAILAGTAANPVPMLVAPEDDWVLQQGWCGTPAVSFLLFAQQLPGRADAWVAKGEPHLTLQALLIDQWLPAMMNGLIPPRLKEFSDLALGEGAFRKEIGAALAGIRLEQTPSGKQAWLPLFGLKLPVPVGEHVWDEEHETRFDTPEQVAAYLRPMFEHYWQ